MVRCQAVIPLMDTDSNYLDLSPFQTALEILAVDNLTYVGTFYRYINGQYNDQCTTCEWNIQDSDQAAAVTLYNEFIGNYAFIYAPTFRIWSLL
jgi:hypothetical protein